MMSIEVLMASNIISLSSRTLQSFSISSFTFAIVSSVTDSCTKRCSSWTSVRLDVLLFCTLCTVWERVVCPHTFLRRLYTVENEVHLAQCFFVHKKRITKRNLHLLGEANENSISNGCLAKNKRCIELMGCWFVVSPT